MTLYRLTTTGARGLLLPSSGFGSLRRNELHSREEDGSTLLRLTTSLEVNWRQPEATAVLDEAIKKLLLLNLELCREGCTASAVGSQYDNLPLNTDVR